MHILMLHRYACCYETIALNDEQLACKSDQFHLQWTVLLQHADAILNALMIFNARLRRIHLLLEEFS